MSLKSGLEQNATCIKQVMERGEMGSRFVRTAVLDAQRLPPLLSPRASCSKGEKGCHLWEGLRSMNQMLTSLVPGCFRVQGFLTEND